MINSSICMDSLILPKRTNVALSSFNKHEVQITKDSLPFSRRLARIGMHITREFSYLQSCSQDSNFLTPSFENKIERNHVVEGNLRIKAIHFKTVLNHYSRHSKLSPNNTSISCIHGRYRLQYKLKNIIEKSEPEVLEVQKSKKKKFSDLVKEHIPNIHQDTSLCYLSKNDLLFMSTANLGTALQLQLHITSCDISCIRDIAANTIDSIGMLIRHPTGNYLVQKLMARCGSFASTVASYCKHSFRDLVSNEYSSRVMQCLIESHEDFRRHALAVFGSDLTFYLRSFSSVFLISLAIKQQKADDLRDVLRFRLFKPIKKLIYNRYYKRILVSYIAVCSLYRLGWLFKQIKRLYPKLSDLLKDRYSSLILMSFIERNVYDLKVEILQSIYENPLEFIKGELFDYFIQQVSIRQSASGFRREIENVFRNLSTINMSVIGKDPLLYIKWNKAVDLKPNRE